MLDCSALIVCDNKKILYIFNQNICSTYIHNLVKLHTCDQCWTKFLFISDIQNGGWGGQETFCWWITSGGFARWFAGKILSVVGYELSCLSLQEYFGKFGELDSVKLKMDPMTGNIYLWHTNLINNLFQGRSRGFAFILYKTEEGLDKSTEVSVFSSYSSLPQHL